MDTDFDVIVIGGGAAGLSAAVEAARLGARVALVDADRKVGGSSALSTGVLYAAGTSVQRAAGIADTAEAMFTYAMTLNAYQAEASLMRTYCDRSADAVEWLLSQGVEFRPEDLYVAGVDTVARGHRANLNGQEIVDALDQSASVAGVTYALNTRVRELLRDGAGRIIGIRLDDAVVTAPAVVIACGGMGANTEMLARYFPDAVVSESAWYIGSRFSRGDGIEMGLAAGGEVGGFNNGLLTVSPGLVREVESYLPGWLMFVNRDGRRFVRETAAYAVMSGVVDAQLGHEAFAIFDEAARASAKVIVTYKPLAPSWTAERLAELIAAGRIAQAPSLAELAEKIGVRAGTLETTVAKYNADCEAGEDTLFFKAASYMRTVAKPPFYGCRLRASMISATSAGLRVDSQARVLDKADRPIAGLYAAGETTCVLPARYLAGGASLTSCVVFGRIAGTAAAQVRMTG